MKMLKELENLKELDINLIEGDSHPQTDLVHPTRISTGIAAQLMSRLMHVYIDLCLTLHVRIWINVKLNIFHEPFRWNSLSNYSSDGNYSNKSSLNDSGVVGDQELDNVSVKDKQLQLYQVRK